MGELTGAVNGSRAAFTGLRLVQPWFSTEECLSQAAALSIILATPER
jgi:hypothetical protein